MAKRKAPASKPVIQNISTESPQDVPMQNGLAGAVGFPENQGSPYTKQISKPTTIFNNMRWYLVSNFRQMLSEAYVELGLIQTIVDVPVDDALRGGIDIKSKQLDPEEIEELQIAVDRDNILTIAGQAAKWNRLFGGAGILILTDQDPIEPFDIESVDEDSPLEFRAVDMWELFWDVQNTEGYDPTIQSETFEFYNYYGEKVHKSRVMRLTGIQAPSFIRPRLRGWGLSICETLVRSINQYLKATDLGFEVLDEFKLDVYKIKNLVNTLLSPNGDQKVRERLAVANYQKNYQNAIVMDAEDDYDHKQLSFAGLAEAMAGIRMQVASDMRMPLTKLFGISASGFNSGEDDIENYNSMVESQVRNKIKYDILRILEIKCQQLFGYVPDDLMVAFKPLRVMSSEQEETVKTQKFARLQQARTLGEISSEEFRDSCNQDNLFAIKLESVDLLNPDAGDIVADDPGASPFKSVVQDGDDLDGDSEKPTAAGGKKDKEAPKAKETQAKGAKEKPAPETKESKTKANSWEESKHPRDDDGKFGEGGGSAKPQATIADNGQIKIKTPKTPAEATQLLKDVGAFLDKAMEDFEKDKSVRASLRLQHAKKQHAAAVNLAKKLVKNEITVMPEPYSRAERALRAVRNSAAFDRASYTADGGDGWIDTRRLLFFDRDKAKDKALWDKAILTAGDNKKFVIWLYKKYGGHFH